MSDLDCICEACYHAWVREEVERRFIEAYFAPPTPRSVKATVMRVVELCTVDGERVIVPAPMMGAITVREVKG